MLSCCLKDSERSLNKHKEEHGEKLFGYDLSFKIIKGVHYLVISSDAYFIFVVRNTQCYHTMVEMKRFFFVTFIGLRNISKPIPRFAGPHQFLQAPMIYVST